MTRPLTYNYNYFKTSFKARYWSAWADAYILSKEILRQSIDSVHVKGVWKMSLHIRNGRQETQFDGLPFKLVD